MSPDWKDQQKILDQINTESPRTVERAGWLAFVIGLLLGSLLMLWAVTANQPNCYEDEIIVWSGETNDHDTCVPINKMVPDSTVYFGD